MPVCKNGNGIVEYLSEKSCKYSVTRTFRNPIAGAKEVYSVQHYAYKLKQKGIGPTFYYITKHIFFSFILIIQKKHELMIFMLNWYKLFVSISRYHRLQLNTLVIYYNKFINTSCKKKFTYNI
jgi:hypothetical protein